MQQYANINIGTEQPENYRKFHNHIVFQTIDDIKEFYEFLSRNDSSTTLMVARGLMNYNYEIYLSISNTLDSIKQLLTLGRINDAFSLIRKYNDAVIMHIYSLIISENEEKLFFDDDYCPYNNIVDKWVCGNKFLIEKGEHKNKDKAYLSEIMKRDKCLFNLIFNKKTNKDYGESRGFGDDNLHYNYWNAFRLNNPKIICYPISISLLVEADKAIKLLFSIHFSYITLLKPESMVSYDYCNDALDEDESINEDAKNYAASIACEIFEKYVMTYDVKLAEYLANCTFLKFRY